MIWAVLFVATMVPPILRISEKPFDYDEVSHAHHAWLMSQGAVPYRDFAMNHLPFFWMLVGPMVNALPQDPASLLILRGVCLALHLIAMGVLAWLFSRYTAAGALAGGLLLAAFAAWPPATDYLVEFRPDALGNVMVAGSLLCWQAGRSGRRWAPAASGILAVVAALVNTKMAAWPFLVAVIALVVPTEAPVAQRLRRVLTFAMGGAVVAAAGTWLLSSRGVNLHELWVSTVLYERAITSVADFLVLPRKLLSHAAVAIPVAAGAGWLAWRIARRRVAADAVLWAALSFVAVYPFLATRSWKQYEMPWILLAGLCSALALASSEGVVRRGWHVVAPLAALLAILAVPRMPGQLHGEMRARDRYVLRAQRALMEEGLSATPRDGYVVGYLPWHPVFRRNTFTRVMEDFGPQGDRYREVLDRVRGGERPEDPDRELAARPPHFIVLGVSAGRQWMTPYPDDRTEALRRYLDQNVGAFETRVLPQTGMVIVERVREAAP